MTRRFPAPPNVGGNPLLVGSDFGRQSVIRCAQIPNRTSGGLGWQVFGGLNNVAGNAYCQVGPTGAWAEWDTILPPSLPGMAWAFGLTYYKGSNAGIMEIRYGLDGATPTNLIASIDTYNATAIRGTTFYAYVDLTGDLITTRPRKITIRFTANGKNAASSATNVYPLYYAFDETPT